MKNLERGPDVGSLNTCPHNFSSGTLLNDWEDLLEVPVDCLMDVTVLHWGFIPDDQISLADEICQIRVLLDTTGRGFVDLNGNLEGGVNCAASFEKKRGNARGCDTNNNLYLTTKRGTESVVYESLACATWTMEKEALARLFLYGLHNEIKGRSLIVVEERDPLLSQLSLLLCIISKSIMFKYHIICQSMSKHVKVLQSKVTQRKALTYNVKLEHDRFADDCSPAHGRSKDSELLEPTPAGLVACLARR